jgi:DNA-directed RNA polymerase II subunit RPB9
MQLNIIRNYHVSFRVYFLHTYCWLGSLNPGHVQKQSFYPILKHIIDVLRMRNSIVKIWNFSFSRTFVGFQSEPGVGSWIRAFSKGHILNFHRLFARTWRIRGCWTQQWVVEGEWIISALPYHGLILTLFRPSNMANGEGPVRLRFCPNSNDLLYPKEDRARNKLVYICRNCDYTVDADLSCVYRHHISHSAVETTAILTDVTSDPTLPRSKNVRCSRCGNGEAVFFSLTTSEGMSLFFQCTSCTNRWKDTGDSLEG